MNADFVSKQFLKNYVIIIIVSW